MVVLVGSLHSQDVLLLVILLLVKVDTEEIVAGVQMAVVQNMAEAVVLVCWLGTVAVLYSVLVAVLQF